MNRVNSTSFISQEELAKGLKGISLRDLTNTRNDEFLPKSGGIPLVIKENRVYVDDTDSHTIIFGSTGSKKTRMFVMPSVEILSRTGESFFVSDPKGEVYKRTSNGVSQRGYDVCCLNLRDFQKGRGWNPFLLPYQLYHRGNKSKAYELVGDIADVLFKNQSENDFFWSNTATNVLTGFILLMFEVGREEECNLKNLIALWKEYRVKSTQFLEKVRADFKDSIIYTKISALDTKSDKTNGSIESYVDMGMNRLAINEEFVDYLSSNDIDFYDLAQKKSAIYLIVPDESEYYHFVVGLFVKQFYMVLIQKAQEEQTLQQRMNFILDEFCNIPEIPEFSNMITAARSRNIRFCLIIQSKKQLKDKYKEKADVITGNCNNWIYLYSREMPLLEEISELCGEVIYDNGMRMPLISTFELQHLDKDKGEALVLVGRNKPCIANLLDIDEYPFSEPDKSEKKELSEKKDSAWDLDSQTAGSMETEEKDCEMQGCNMQDCNMQDCNIEENEPLSFFRSTNKLNAYVFPYNDVIQPKPRRFSLKQWLVATYHGMIIDSAIVESLDITDGYVYPMMQNRNETLYKYRNKIKWYYADTKLAETYHNTLSEHPEYVFLTIKELGEKHFTSLNSVDGYEELKATEDLHEALFGGWKKPEKSKQKP